MTRQQAWTLTKQTFSDWSNDKVPRLAAALAYYTAFSIAPMLVIIIAILGFVYGQEAAQGKVSQQLQSFVGQAPAQASQQWIENAGHHGSGIMATVIGIILLFFGATGVFGELQDSMNTIWQVKPKEGRGIWGTIKDRIFSFAMVLGLAFLLLVSLVVSTVVTTLTHWIAGDIALVSYVVDILVSLGVITVIFAMIFKLLPDVEVRWRNVWLAAGITAVLFTIGKFLLGLYLTKGSTASVFGAAGSLAALLIWVYYSAQILFLGAEFSKAYARMFQKHVPAAENAKPVTAEARARQGLKPSAVGDRSSPPAPRPQPAPARMMIVRNPPRGHSSYAPYIAAASGLAAGALLGGTGTWFGLRKMDEEQHGPPERQVLLDERLHNIEKKMQQISRSVHEVAKDQPDLASLWPAVKQAFGSSKIHREKPRVHEWFDRWMHART